MKNKICIIPFIVLAFLSAGCKKNHVINEKQHILFQYEYLKYTPEYIHLGFYINDAGGILQYKNPENWNFFTSDYNISENQLADNLSRCTALDEKIDRDNLIKFSSYIDNIASSKITAKKIVSVDAGTKIFVCYNYDEQNGIYKGTLLKMEGDTTCENLNFYSKKLTLWLRDLKNKNTVE